MGKFSLSGLLGKPSVPAKSSKKETLAAEPEVVLLEESNPIDFSFPEMGPYDLWGRIDKTTGFLAVTDRKGSSVWVGGMAAVNKNARVGRYLEEELETLQVIPFDSDRWSGLVDFVESKNGKFYVDIVEEQNEETTE